VFFISLPFADFGIPRRSILSDLVILRQLTLSLILRTKRVIWMPSLYRIKLLRLRVSVREKQADQPNNMGIPEIVVVYHDFLVYRDGPEGENSLESSSAVSRRAQARA